MTDQTPAAIAVAAPERHAYQTLDGLRGFAAVAVLLFHMHDTFPAVWRPGSAYLAVDLFFLLSGFVLAEAYATRLDAGMEFAPFMHKRLLRLWPLYVLGLLIALAPVTLNVILGQAPLSALYPFVLGVAYLPWILPGAGLYPYNHPAWSLLFELFANLVMAAAWRWLSNRVLLALVAVAAAGLVASVLVFGSLDTGATPEGAAVALARVTFSFFGGILLWRVPRCAIVLNAWIPVLVLGMILVVSVGGGARQAFDLVAVAMLFPIIIWTAATTRPGAASAILFGAIGAASYAIYATHVPLLALLYRVTTKIIHLPATATPGWIALPLVASFLILGWMLARGDVYLRSRIALRSRSVLISRRIDRNALSGADRRQIGQP